MNASTAKTERIRPAEIKDGAVRTRTAKANDVPVRIRPVGVNDTSISIRTAEVNDAGRLLDIYAYYVTKTAVSFECAVPSLAEFRSRIEKTLAKYPYLVLEENGVVRGYAYAGVFKDREAYDRSCEMTIYLEHGAEGRGYGRLLYEVLEKDLKDRGILNLYACIGDPVTEDEYLTKNSEQFHRHLGYRKVGEFHKCGYKFDRWYNMIWMEKMIGEHL